MLLGLDEAELHTDASMLREEDDDGKREPVPPAVLERLTEEHEDALVLRVTLSVPDGDAVPEEHGDALTLRAADAVAPLPLVTADTDWV